ncbi:MAG TPA: aspartate 1-decarboxylase [Bacteroidetes bacterium]|nr:aspartate 1-decarboxylase [Bacteroidota bacterium]
MWLHMLKSKIHRVRVTELALDYEGSITIDQDLLDAANMFPNEKVQVLNINNGERAETYIIPGERGSGVIGLNGALARLAQVGDLLIVIAYCVIPEEKAMTHKTRIVLVDEKNHVKEVLD